MSLLLSAGSAPVFDPANGFPWPQSAPAMLAAPRVVQSFQVLAPFQTTAFNPSNGFPWLKTNEVVRPAPRGEGSYAYVPALNRWGLEDLSWLSKFPEAARRSLDINEYVGRVSYVPALSRWGIDGGRIPWRGTYPDEVARRAPDVNTWRGQFAIGLDLASFALPVPLVWQGRFPERVPTATRPTESQMSLVQIVADTVTPLSWKPRFEDFIRVAPRPTESWHAYVPALNRWGLEDLSWLSKFPEAARRAPDTNEWLGGIAYTPALSRWGLEDLSWLSKFPEAARRALDPNEYIGLIAYVPALSRWGLDDLSWLSKFPEAARRALDVNEWLGRIAYVPAINRWGLDDIPWLPAFPDEARRAPDVNAWRGQFAIGLDLASFALPVPLVWQGRFPEVAPGFRPNVHSYFITHISAEIFPLPSPLVWLPTFPERVPAALRAESELRQRFVLWPQSNIWRQYEERLEYDPNAFAPQRTIRFEAVISVSGGGTAFARLYNYTDDVAIAGSEVSTASATPVLVRSAALSLSALAKDYYAQGGVVLGGQIQVHSARMVIDG